MHQPRDKWTAFLLSLAVPGVGQLWAGSVTSLAWFAAAGGTAAFWLAISAEAEGETGKVLLVGQFISLVLIGLLSAEHAKRLFEPRANVRRRTAPSPTCRAHSQGRTIRIDIEIESTLTASELWRRVADLDRFLTIDPFHERVVLMRDAPESGVDLVLWHNAFGRRFARFGRILSWREGEGYAFSDLSPRGPHAGFPHVFYIRVLPASGIGSTSRLLIEVRGKWTSRLAPAALGRTWIWIVCREHARLLRKGL